MSTNMFKDAWQWYKNLAWYWKILAFAVLIVIGVLWVLSLLRKAADGGAGTTVSDQFVTDRTDTQLDDLQTQADVAEDDIKKAQAVIVEKLSQANLVDTETAQRREAIEAARTMAELDELQKKWSL